MDNLRDHGVEIVDLCRRDDRLVDNRLRNIGHRCGKVGDVCPVNIGLIDVSLGYLRFGNIRYFSGERRDLRPIDFGLFNDSRVDVGQHRVDGLNGNMICLYRPRRYFDGGHASRLQSLRVDALRLQVPRGDDVRLQRPARNRSAGDL